MENIVFKNKKEIIDLLENHTIKKLGKGGEGVVYLLDNGCAAKFYHCPYKPHQDVLRFKDIIVPPFEFIRATATLNGILYFTLSNPAPGIDLESGSRLDYDMVTVGSHLKEVVKGTNQLTEMNIEAFDVCRKNLIYDGKRFTIIDTTHFDYSNEPELRRHNFIKVMGSLYNAFLSGIFDVGEEFFNKKYIEQEYLENPEEYLRYIRDRVREVTQKEVNTFREARHALAIKYHPCSL